jgi:hypothetical protein
MKLSASTTSSAISGLPEDITSISAHGLASCSRPLNAVLLPTTRILSPTLISATPSPANLNKKIMLIRQLLG